MRSFFVVISFITGGWIYGTRAMYVRICCNDYRADVFRIEVLGYEYRGRAVGSTDYRDRCGIGDIKADESRKA